MNQSSVENIKRSQKESFLLKEISKMIHQLSLDEPKLAGLTINRVQLSRDKSVCNVYFYDPDGIEAFKEKKQYLILYKPSLKKSIASAMHSRYVPDIKFIFDIKFEKQQKIESIIDKVKKEFKEDE